MTETGAPAAAPAAGQGASIGKYRLVRWLGAGGMGVVWAAYDPDLERTVAIKLLRSVDSAATLRTRLLREARAMARLKHPNVLKVYEIGTNDNRDYIAMELIDGGDLHSWLAYRPPRAEIFAALLAAGRGLAAAHEAGLIHRDLKPHNILRGRDGWVYVTDFGVARGQIEVGTDVVLEPVSASATAVNSQLRAVDVLDARLTQTGALIGTPAYMAPEQFAGRAADQRSDQFAFCVTAWEAITGARPFTGKMLDDLRAASAAGTDRLILPEKVLPLRIRRVLARGMAADPQARWPDMRALLRELEAAIASLRWHPRYTIAAISLVAVGAITGVAVGMRDEYKQRLRTVTETENSRALAATGADATSGRDCRSAAEAFGPAWSAERRAAVTDRHRSDGALVAMAAALDEARRDWVASYDATCARPASATRHERLACLFEARDQIDEVTRELAAGGSELSLTSLTPLREAIGACKRE